MELVGSNSTLYKKVKIKHQEAVWLYCVSKLRGNRSYLLCGGAPRNWSIGLPANDLDFYIQPPSHADPFVVGNEFLWGKYWNDTQSGADLFERVGEYFEEAVEKDPAFVAPPLTEGVVGIWQKDVFGQRVQFMVCNTLPSIVVGMFSCNMSKIFRYSDGTYRIYEAYMDGIKHQRLVFNNNVDLDGKFATKYKSYFPHYKVMTASQVAVAHLEDEV